MTDRLVELTLTEIKPDSADYKNRLTLGGPLLRVGIQTPEELFISDGVLSPEGLAYVMTEIDLAIQRGYALRKSEYEDIISGRYVAKKRGKKE